MMDSTNSRPKSRPNWASRKKVSLDPTTLAINESMTMVSAMRRTNRWSQTGVAALLSASDIFGSHDTDDDPSDEGFANNFSSRGFSDKSINYNGTTCNSRSGGAAAAAAAAATTGGGKAGGSDSPLLSSFLQLRSILCESESIYEIDSLTLLQPFLLVIKSSTTSGYVTGLALNAVSKFLIFDLISLESKNVQNSLIQIVSALTHCRFEAEDQNSDDAVLLKVLRLLEKLVESSLATLLPNESVSEIVQTCLSLACNKRRSEVLRRAAEMSMVSITVKIFSKLKELEPEHDMGNDLRTNFTNTKLPEDVIGGTEAESEAENRETVLNNNGTEPVSKNVTTEAAATTSSEQKHLRPSSEEEADEPFGIVCINEFLGILVSIISPSNQHQHMESTRVFALSLINAAVEVAGFELAKYPSLLTMIADPVSKYVLQIVTTTDSISLLKSALQLFSTISIVLGNQLKPQFELSIRIILQTLQPEALSTEKSQARKANVQTRSPISKELMLESLSLLWTRSPAFFTQLFVDYDCDFEKTDLSTDFLKFLCKLSLPEAAFSTTHNVPPLCLEGILSFIAGVSERSKAHKGGSKSELSDRYIENRRRKTAFIRCTELLNENPKEGIKMLAREKFIKDDSDHEEIANFFFSKSGRLNKKILGEYLAKPKNSNLLDIFIGLFDFENLRVDEALRILLKSFRLPGESQQIERIVEKFAEKYVSCQKNSELNHVDLSMKSPTKRRSSAGESGSGGGVVGVGGDEIVRPDKDSVFILSYSIIMLNTDLHNPQVKRQMLLDDYERNLRGVYNGKDFPAWYLSKIYCSIKDREIIMPEEHHGTDKWFDDVWHNLVSTQDINHCDRIELDIQELCNFDKVLLADVIEQLVTTLMTVYKEALDDHVVTRLMSCIDKITNICLAHGLYDAVDDLTLRLIQFCNLSKDYFRKGPHDDNIRDDIPITQIKIEKKEEEVYVGNLAVWFGRDFKAQLAAVMLFRLIRKSNCKVTKSWNKVIEVILNLFENCLVDPNLFVEFQKKIQIGPLPKVQPHFVISRPKPLNNSGILSTFSSFLKSYSDEPPEPSDAEVEATISSMDCIASFNIPNIFAIVSKSEPKNLQAFIHLLLSSLPEEQTDKTKRYYETETLFILEASVCFCLLLNNQNLMEVVLSKLEASKLSTRGQLRLTTYKLLLLRYYKNEETLMSTIKSLSSFDKDLISKHGGQILQPLLSLLDEDSWCCKKLLLDESYWNSLRFFGSLQVYASDIVPFLEGFISNSNSNGCDISPDNFISILGLMDEISSLGAIGSQYEHESEYKGGNLAPNPYYNDVISLAKQSIELTARLASMLQREEFQKNGLSYSLIQALAHQCFNPCREVREYAVKTLHTITASIEIKGDVSFSGIFEFGFFPLLSELSKPYVFQGGANGFAKTQNEVFSLVSKVFLKNVDELHIDDVKLVWFQLLDKLQDFVNINGKLLKPESVESNKETLKNMVLVLQANGILTNDHEEILKTSVEKIGTLFPQLNQELGLMCETIAEETPNVEEAKTKKVIESESG
ncbi:GEA2 [Candida oxycetoniae]|uniref:GEA2 n=1 Tax=Candida oxycetoniae TaxID=497107 RepID=A0AAI9STI2_9ASCO|nr:GEA2 [Candida oxycetoniae]KAI3402523.2 GEA2 [Candida oxycetoniae]